MTKILKKWIQKRKQKSSSKSTVAEEESRSSTKTGKRSETSGSVGKRLSARSLAKLSPNRLKNKLSKTRSPNRKPSYNRIQKEELPPPGYTTTFPKPMIVPTNELPAVFTEEIGYVSSPSPSSESSRQSSSPSFPPEMSISDEHQIYSSSSQTASESDTKSHRSDKSRKSHQSSRSIRSRRSRTESDSVIEPPVETTVESIGETKKFPIVKIRPIQSGPPPDPFPKAFSDLFEEDVKESPPPPTLTSMDEMAHELSYSDVAAPPSIAPSIDSFLFASDPTDKDTHTSEKESSVSRDQPVAVQTILSATPFEKGVFRQGGKDDAFLTTKTPQSGTGSKRLQLWIDEVKRSISAEKDKTHVPVRDRYYVDTTDVDEEKSNKSSSSTGTSQDLLKRQENIEESLRKSIQKSKAQMTTAPKGILKNSFVEAGTIKMDEEKTFSFDDDDDDDQRETTNRDHYAFVEAKEAPIKVFSKSLRQRLRDGDWSVEEEVTSMSSRSQNSTGSEGVYESLHQLHPTASRDETQKSTSSGVHFLFSRLCEMDLGRYEDDIFGMNDGISIGDDTYTSQSTISKDSYIASTGWACFGVF